MAARLIAFLTSFAVIVVAAIVGNVLESKGILTREKLGPSGIATVKCIFSGLFVVTGLTLIPLVLRVFIAGQIKAGNGELTVIRWLQAHENTVVYIFWGVIVFGLFIAGILAKDHIAKHLA